MKATRKRVCSVAGCDKRHYARGLCSPHYRKAEESGSLPPAIHRLAIVADSLAGYLAHHPWDVTPSGCWEWNRSRVRGYGRFVVHGKSFSAHRTAWALANGSTPPADMVVMHLCDNPPCVNPDHLTLGTPADNVHDMLDKGRQNTDGLALGRRGTARLAADRGDLERAQQMRMDGHADREIAAALNVSRSHANRLARGITTGDYTTH